MANRRGISTKIVLAIGIIILTAIVMIAAARFTAPLFKGTTKEVSEELALSMDAIYAAPEDLTLMVKLTDSDEELWVAHIEKSRACAGAIKVDTNILEGLGCTVFGVFGFITGDCGFGIKTIDDDTVELVGGGPLSGKLTCRPVTASENTSIGELHFLNTVKISKTYDETIRKNKIKESS